jgi:hypothetical protein
MSLFTALTAANRHGNYSGLPERGYALCPRARRLLEKWIGLLGREIRDALEQFDHTTSALE